MKTKEDKIEEVLSILKGWDEARKMEKYLQKVAKQRDKKHALIASIVGTLIILAGLFLMIYPYREYLF